MASTIAAITTGVGGVVTTADATGNLSLLSGATTIVAVTSTGAAVTGTLSASGVSTFAAGTALLPALTTTGDTNTGVWFPAADTIAASTAGTEQMRIDSAGLLKFNSGYGSAATAYGCRAWCNFNGTGTVAIRASGNVSSITDGGTGIYTVNFTTAMTDANYNVNVNARGSGDFNRGGGGMVYLPNTTPTTSAISFTTAVGSSAGSDGLAFDMDFVYVAVFR